MASYLQGHSEKQGINIHTVMTTQHDTLHASNMSVRNESNECDITARAFKTLLSKSEQHQKDLSPVPRFELMRFSVKNMKLERGGILGQKGGLG